jgi:acyl dehydratase
MTTRYLEDFEAGQKFASGRLRIDSERMRSFAAEFDPQHFHLDEDSARKPSSRDWQPAAGTPRR